jgi:multidrug efflux pump subunit AcrB
MVVILLLLSSWFLSMYVTPTMCFWFMKVKPLAPAGEPASGGASQENAEDAYAGGFYRVYRGLLERILSLRLIVSIGAVAAIVLGGFIASQLVREFFGPSTDRNQFLVYVDLPAGYRLESTDETVQRLNAWLNNKDINPEITDTVAYVGFGGPRFFLVLSPVQPNPHVAFLVVSTEKAEQVPDVMRRLRQRFLDDFPEAAGRVKQMWMAGGWIAGHAR